MCKNHSSIRCEHCDKAINDFIIEMSKDIKTKAGNSYTIHFSIDNKGWNKNTGDITIQPATICSDCFLDFIDVFMDAIVQKTITCRTLEGYLQFLNESESDGKVKL